MKEESEKAGLKLSIQKTKIIASGLVRSHHFMAINGDTMETVTGFIFVGYFMAINGDTMETVTGFIFVGYSREIKRRLLLGRKTMTNLDSVLKTQRHYFADKGL